MDALTLARTEILDTLHSMSGSGALVRYARLFNLFAQPEAVATIFRLSSGLDDLTTS
jgi:hypothetical protein